MYKHEKANTFALYLAADLYCMYMYTVQMSLLLRVKVLRVNVFRVKSVRVNVFRVSALRVNVFRVNALRVKSVRVNVFRVNVNALRVRSVRVNVFRVSALWVNVINQQMGREKLKLRIMESNVHCKYNYKHEG